MKLSNLEVTEINPKEDGNSGLLQSLIDVLHLNEQELDKPLPIIPKSRILLNLKLFNKKSHYWRYFLLRGESETKTITVGYLKFSTMLEQDLHLSSIHLFIKPMYRGRGFARHLLKICEPYVSERVTTLEFMQRQEINGAQIPLHNLFTRIGGKLSYLEQVNVSDLHAFDQILARNRSKALIEQASKKGYQLKLYENGSFKDDDIFDFQAYISLLERINNDMPRDDTSWEDEHWTESRLMERYETIKEKGEQFWDLIVIHSQTNKPVGMTAVVIQDDFPLTVNQMETGVVAEHRGNKLGLTLKYAMLERILTHPLTKRMKYWKTENANSNQHMLAINTELGYKPIFCQAIYEVSRMGVQIWVDT